MSFSMSGLFFNFYFTVMSNVDRFENPATQTGVDIRISGPEANF